MAKCLNVFPTNNIMKDKMPDVKLLYPQVKGPETWQNRNPNAKKPLHNQPSEISAMFMTSIFLLSKKQKHRLGWDCRGSSSTTLADHICEVLNRPELASTKKYQNLLRDLLSVKKDITHILVRTRVANRQTIFAKSMLQSNSVVRKIPDLANTLRIEVASMAAQPTLLSSASQQR